LECQRVHCVGGREKKDERELRRKSTAEWEEEIKGMMDKKKQRIK